MKVKAIISALMLMACGMASAQTKTYLNVETAPGVYKSFEVNADLKISWGEKKELPFGQGYAAAKGIGMVKWIQLWENGPKFAEYNVGATSATDYGGYYAWGGSQDKVDDHNTGSEELSGDNDTATKLWGSNWRMPTSAELSNAKDGLLHECVCTWTTDYEGTGVNGLLCKGQGDYKDNSVFLPAAGYCDRGSVNVQGSIGFYWSSTPNVSYNAYFLYFDSGSQLVRSNSRDVAYSVRAVLAEQ